MIAFEIDPNVVRPGWTPLIITVLLAIVMFFLYRSMKRQFGRIQHLPTEAEAAATRRAERVGASTGVAGATGNGAGSGRSASGPAEPAAEDRQPVRDDGSSSS